ncbi:MAG: trigger factor [Betaproteobacteria bacterium RIFCSPLOWO2_12_FULL_67_28]|nr:MAG: trigger factor [Betaproteobacteria bacterium RIFCSPLOWO2_02_FULL_68_150]OGA55299.1 MAG: trigger factor [Betaproteobacteria bacterium RIFCSPLOWO2_12_FULL_67_28]
MAAEVETLGALERRLSMSLPVDEIERQVDTRLKQLARNVKLPGFRPGKVPLKLVQQQYGPQVRSEVLGDAVQKAFGEAIKGANLKVAGYPRIEKKDAGSELQALEFSATFEIYPEVKVGDLAAASVERPQLTVDEAAIEKTLQILRQQRTEWIAVERAAQDGDRLTVDFDGRIGGERFDGGNASGLSFTLGERRMLPEFESAARGLNSGEAKAFDLKFPDDYAGKAVAGKTAAFSLAVTRVEEPRLPALDAEFAKRLGVADGDLEKMRVDVRANVEREVRKRVDARVKGQALQRLLDATPLELPKALVHAEAQHLVEMAAADLKARGLKLENVPLDPQAFEANARRRVALGLIVGELARTEKLQPKPAEVRALIEAEAQSYESPAEMVKWFYMQPQRLSEMESLALENNVVGWVLSKARVTDKPVSFDELMGGA